MKKYALILCLMFAFPFAGSTLFGQSCTLTLSYFVSAGGSITNAFIADQSPFLNGVAIELNNSTGIQTSPTATNIVPNSVGDFTFDLNFPLVNPGDSASIVSNMSDPNFLLTVEINHLQGTPLQSFVFFLSFQSSTLNCTQVTPVPTLSQWGLILFALLLLNIGAVAIYKSRRRIHLT